MTSTPSRESIARHYDSLDPFYRDLWGEEVHHGLWRRGDETAAEAIRGMTAFCIEKLALPEGARVADVGCGYGAAARRMAREKGAAALGLTLSAAQKRYADRQPVERGSVEVRVQDWAEADFAEGSLDGALSLESLEHIADKEGFARTFHRALKPGGRLVVATWLRAEEMPGWRRRHLIEAIAREGRLPPFATLDGLRRTFRAAGFAGVEAEDLHPRVRRTWSVILRRLALKALTRPDYVRFLFTSSAEDRVFALTALRIWLAYRTGCIRYGFYVCVK